mmetsp:Transcript_6748/g.19968  ORF Transcript_6748/g.19968 Transcript_6748/m.19968 type:complete len:679 (-) Transcript_6748:105-2141(-)
MLARFESCLREAHLEYLQPEHLVLDQAAHDKAVHADLAGLADAEGPVHRLCVGRWVPRWVHHDHTVSACQVEADAADAGRQQHAVEPVGLLLELGHLLGPGGGVRLPVDTQAAETLGLEAADLDEVQHLDALAEDQGAVAPARQRGQELGQAPELGALLQHRLGAPRQPPQHGLRGAARASLLLGGGLLGLVARQLRAAAALLQQLGPGPGLGRRHEQQRVVAEPLEQADGPEDLDAELALGAGLADDVALLQDLLVDEELLLARRQPDDGLLLRRQLRDLCVALPGPVVRRPVADGQGLGPSGARALLLVPQQPHARLRAPQQVWRHERSELFREVLLQLHSPGLGTPDAAPVDGVAEGLHKCRVIAEQPGLRKVHQRPKVLERVLHGRAREQDAATRPHVAQALAQQRRDVFHAVGLVADHDVPGPRGACSRQAACGHLGLHLLLLAGLLLRVVVVHAPRLGGLGAAAPATAPAAPAAPALLRRRRRVVHGHAEELVRVADQGVRSQKQTTCWPADPPERLGALGGGAVVEVHWPPRAPSPGLLGPLVEQRHREQQQGVRGAGLPGTVEKGAELDGLPKAHFIGQDAALPALEQTRHPGNARALVRVEPLEDVSRQPEGLARLLAGELHGVRAPRAAAPLPLHLLVLLHQHGVAPVLGLGLGRPLGPAVRLHGPEP